MNFFQYATESAYDLSHDLSSRNDKPCRTVAWYFLPEKPERKSIREFDQVTTL